MVAKADRWESDRWRRHAPPPPRPMPMTPLDEGLAPWEALARGAELAVLAVLGLITTALGLGAVAGWLARGWYGG